MYNETALMTVSIYIKTLAFKQAYWYDTTRYTTDVQYRTSYLVDSNIHNV